MPPTAEHKAAAAAVTCARAISGRSASHTIGAWCTHLPCLVSRARLPQHNVGCLAQVPFFVGCMVYNIFPGHLGVAGAAVLRFLVYGGAVMQVPRTYAPSLFRQNGHFPHCSADSIAYASPRLMTLGNPYVTADVS